MTDNLHSDQEKNFVEEVGIVFEQIGLPRMAGRIFGWLLIATPPYQSSAELAEVLMASKGSISTASRLLMQIGLVERFIIPGVRHDYFRLGQDALQRTIRHGLEDEITMFRKLAEQGIKMVKNESSVRRQWLEEMRSRYAFLEKEFPLLMERYKKQQVGNRPKSQVGKDNH